MSARVAVIPAPFNTGSVVSVFPLYATVGTAGVDAVGAGGVAFATAWPGTISGVQIPNQGNGAVWLYYTAGATAPGVYQVLVGELVGGTGQVLPATTETGTIAASTSGWLGPWSPATYNQMAPTVAAPASPINATALTAAAQFCVVADFTVTTNLCVRAYQFVTVTP
jgi:hypothetical protein